jgi:hypothetical protein
MRTTLTLDEDVRSELEEVCRSRNQKLRTVVNEALRAGLLVLRNEPPRPLEPYRTEPVSLGRPRLPDLDNIAEVLAVAEGDDRP